MNQIFEDRFLFEEGTYRVYVTDEKGNMNQKDIHFEYLMLYILYPISRRASIVSG